MSSCLPSFESRTVCEIDFNLGLSSSSTVSSTSVSSASSQPEEFTTSTSTSGAAPVLSPTIQSEPHLVYAEAILHDSLHADAMDTSSEMIPSPMTASQPPVTPFRIDIAASLLQINQTLQTLIGYARDLSTRLGKVESGVAEIKQLLTVCNALVLPPMLTPPPPPPPPPLSSSSQPLRSLMIPK
ncbi:hypothetical protein L2E82_45312 [Cichorium intybus]|uniref:Uncharacterized protein n=1 Tax=Cichorium intybus TaxID=13427 RepID=A0ACB8ZX14_CICIN|nr:hypothetical protein L2E82_45312 [Cichorium intybus]